MPRKQKSRVDRALARHKTTNNRRKRQKRHQADAAKKANRGKR